jgi:threonylcarbamoyladenosine tRNA methylthiotransferase MtaB
MVKIQEGCDQVCAYCIVPKVRGRERSIPPESIVANINRQCGEGCREAVLTGTQLGTYGFDIPGANLVGLIQRILAETSIDRLRVSSLQAQEITPELLDLWGDTRLCPHFHIPLQSGSDTVLRAMRRRYDTERFAQTVELVRRTISDAGITTDIIVGFPGEGDSDFEDGFRFARSMAFSAMHVFPYSQRPGTSAAYFKSQVDEGVKKGRMGQMLDLAGDGRQRFRQEQLGSFRSVLWEPKRSAEAGDIWTGLTGNYIRVRADSRRDLANTITDAQLTEVDGDWVLAVVD